MRETRGSVQVVEFSYVFPVVLMTVISLVYLALILFFYVFAFNLTEEAADEALQAVSDSERVYWQLSSQSVDADTEAEITERLEKRLHRMQIVPWVKFTATLGESSSGSVITATASCTFFGKEVYSVVSTRQVYVPTEYAQNVDLAETVADQSGLVETLKEKFSQYVKKDRTYEIF